LETDSVTYYDKHHYFVFRKSENHRSSADAGILQGTHHFKGGRAGLGSGGGLGAKEKRLALPQSLPPQVYIKTFSVYCAQITPRCSIKTPISLAKQNNAEVDEGEAAGVRHDWISNVLGIIIPGKQTTKDVAARKASRRYC